MIAREKTITEFMIEEQRRFLEVERAYTEALIRAYQARTTLLRAVGDAR